MYRTEWKMKMCILYEVTIQLFFIFKNNYQNISQIFLKNLLHATTLHPIFS
jgi:hypothetical protein